MDHEYYVTAAYALTFSVMTIVALKVLFAGRGYRRQFAAISAVRRRQRREGE
ncbi:heme exporter protein CcmD [Rhizobium redzepovicii]|uniref:Heme exporter protein CcmD n=1 Tax=Rhizobium redzepovicii TaxID=2867518 RepID=A0AAW8PBL0_9HYPH|nr:MULTISPECIES: heme exporter protein CcmD [Rhizobium]MBB3525075.1 heme exporter protein D [Rhizobium sp. BK456]MBY4593152.1 heme exporter protein CcmD [Rhizobium redzepovicii]MBY4615726.1 heme exporter protein CcmD [Rhizobium redzepovicii]MDF0664375.1 heme exporter protein CcmD [Rhizobium sp. BC49]MDR9764405.1 heme exporter protein CcmD [Rhizobium redzepovicii]